MSIFWKIFIFLLGFLAFVIILVVSYILINIFFRKHQPMLIFDSGDEEIVSTEKYEDPLISSCGFQYRDYNNAYLGLASEEGYFGLGKKYSVEKKGENYYVFRPSDKENFNPYYRSYYLCLPEVLPFDKSDKRTRLFPSYIKEVFDGDCEDKSCILAPLSIVPNINSGHAVLVFIEVDRENGNKIIIYDSYFFTTTHFDVSANILEQVANHLSPILKSKKQNTYYYNNCGLQLRDRHCVKHVFVLMFGILRTGVSFEKFKEKDICPGNSIEDLLKKPIDTSTMISVSGRRPSADGRTYNNLDSIQVRELIKFSPEQKWMSKERKLHSNVNYKRPEYLSYKTPFFTSDMLSVSFPHGRSINHGQIINDSIKKSSKGDIPLPSIISRRNVAKYKSHDATKSLVEEIRPQKRSRE